MTLFPTWASSGHGSTAWPLGWPHLDLVTGGSTWASSGRGYSIPSGTDLIVVTLVTTWESPGPVNLVPIWASPSPADFVPHLDLIAVDAYLASPGTGTLILSVRHPDLVTLVLTWASLVPGDSVPHLSLTWT